MYSRLERHHYIGASLNLDVADVADVALVADTRERESLHVDSGILGPYPKPFESAKHAVVLPTNS